MHDGTIAEIGGRRRDEVADPRTSRLEFWQEPLRLPSPRGLVCIHGLQLPGASDYPCKKRLVASFPVAVSRRVIRLLRQPFQSYEQELFDDDDVLYAFGD